MPFRLSCLDLVVCELFVSMIKTYRLNENIYLIVTVQKRRRLLDIIGRIPYEDEERMNGDEGNVGGQSGGRSCLASVRKGRGRARDRD